VISADLVRSEVLWSFNGVIVAGVATERLVPDVAASGVIILSYTLSDGGTVNSAPD